MQMQGATPALEDSDLLRSMLSHVVYDYAIDPPATNATHDYILHADIVPDDTTGGLEAFLKYQFSQLPLEVYYTHILFSFITASLLFYNRFSSLL